MKNGLCFSAALLAILLTGCLAGCGSTASSDTATRPQPASTSGSYTSLGGLRETPAVTARRELPADAPKIKILTWNVNFGGPGADQAVQILRDADADVVCLQETTDAWAALLRGGLADRYPYIRFRNWNGAGGQGVLSKHPIGNVAWINPQPTPPPGARQADRDAATGGWFPGWIFSVKTPAGEFQICNVHLRPPFDDRGGVSMASLLEADTIHRKELQSYLARRSPDLPLFVTGDFNENDGGGGMQFLAEHQLADALSQFDQLAVTWHWQIKGALLTGRYDHILHPDAYLCTAAKVIKKGDSDHYPVLAEFALAPK